MVSAEICGVSASRDQGSGGSSIAMRILLAGGWDETCSDEHGQRAGPAWFPGESDAAGLPLELPESMEACSCKSTGGRAGRMMQSAQRAPHGQRIIMDVIERIRQTVESHPVVLFMKGTPQFPMCGFSSRTAQVLKAVNAEYHSVNVLEDPEIRANLPRFSDWPTFPQLFVNGELIGGCDIALELYESGELARLVQDARQG